MANNTARIAEINAILQQGVVEHVVDGETVKYDLDALRRERRRLIMSDDTGRHRRPVASTINLSGFRP